MAKIYPFSVGAIQAWVLGDSDLPVTPLEEARSFLEHIPESATDPIFESYPPHFYVFSHNCLLLVVNGQRVLVDVGNGVNPARPEVGHLLTHLQALRIAPSEIDLIIFTHLHGDHINGAFGKEGKLLFSNARYVMNRVEYEFWAGDVYPARYPPEAKVQMHQKLATLKPHLTLLEAGEEAIAGVQLVAAYGHTAGHSAIRVESQGEALLHLVDTFHIVVQVARPQWSPRFDSDPEQAAVTRAAFIQQVMADQTLIQLYHLPFPALGYIVQADGEAYWKPINN